MTDLLLGIGGITTLGFMLYAGEPSEPTWWLLAIPFAAWSVIPYGALAVVARRLGNQQTASRIVLAAAALTSVIAIAALYTTFIAYADAQSGLVFLFLPVWQTVAALPLLGLYRFLVR